MNSQTATICNNMLLGVSMVALSEAPVLGEKLRPTHQFFVKNLGLAANALRDNGVDGQLGLLAAEIYHRFNQAQGGKDCSAIVTEIRNRSDQEGA